MNEGISCVVRLAHFGKLSTRLTTSEILSLSKGYALRASTELSRSPCRRVIYGQAQRNIKEKGNPVKELCSNGARRKK